MTCGSNTSGNHQVLYMVKESSQYDSLEFNALHLELEMLRKRLLAIKFDHKVELVVYKKDDIKNSIIATVYHGDTSLFNVIYHAPTLVEICNINHVSPERNGAHGISFTYDTTVKHLAVLVAVLNETGEIMNAFKIARMHSKISL